LTTEVQTLSAPDVLEAQPTLGDWLEEWLGLCEVRGLRQTTIVGYRRVLDFYLPAPLKETRIGDLRPRELNVLYARLLKSGRRRGVGGLSARTVRFLHTLLRKALADACRQGLIGINPADAADPPSRRASQARVFPTWTPAELRCFLEASKDDHWYAALHLAASTGLRRGELLGLRWGDLDLEAAELQVVQTVVQVSWEPELSSPKTPNSRRRVALDRHTVAVLDKHWHAARLKAADGTLEPTDLVFPNPKGGPAHPDSFSAHFQRLIKKAGARRVRLHDLRHSHATHALRAGIHPKIVSERPGHASVSTTLDLYAHAVPTMQREAAEVVASLVADSAAGGSDPSTSQSTNADTDR
jgi:integrase